MCTKNTSCGPRRHLNDAGFVLLMPQGNIMHVISSFGLNMGQIALLPVPNARFQLKMGHQGAIWAVWRQYFGRNDWYALRIPALSSFLSADGCLPNSFTIVMHRQSREPLNYAVLSYLRSVGGSVINFEKKVENDEKSRFCTSWVTLWQSFSANQKVIH